ncbi:MAG: hypothetical protein BWZ10_01442 [candidate division BRC1 bacterium ADurb.BinA364]|nr:MAG: hypothetical protein BWZ10_01442 [candidate division BRC1 bacterium ADurb.BinA364]
MPYCGIGRRISSTVFVNDSAERFIMIETRRPVPVFVGQAAKYPYCS